MLSTTWIEMMDCQPTKMKLAQLSLMRDDRLRFSTLKEEQFVFFFNANMSSHGHPLHGSLIMSILKKILWGDKLPLLPSLSMEKDQITVTITSRVTVAYNGYELSLLTYTTGPNQLWSDGITEIGGMGMMELVSNGAPEISGLDMLNMCGQMCVKLAKKARSEEIRNKAGKILATDDYKKVCKKLYSLLI